MARAPKNRTWIRQIRDASCMNQKDFAHDVGVNTNTYQSYELGRISIPAAVEKIIGTATGGCRASKFMRLRKGEGDFAVGTISKGLSYYTEEHFKFWRKKGKPGMPKHKPEDLAEAFTSWAEVLLQAADRKHPSAIDQVYAYLCDALNTARKDFELEEGTDKILDQRKQRHTFRLTIGQLRKNPEFAKGFKFRYKPLHADGTVVEDCETVDATIVRAPEWHPGVNPVPEKNV